MTGRSCLALAALAALLCGCLAESSSPAATASAASQVPDVPVHEPEPYDPSDMAYVDWEDSAFTVIASAEADALFEEVAACTNDVDGYTVEYPASWHTNEGGEAPGCSWFGPDPLVGHDGMRLAALVRPDIPIALRVVRTGLGQIPEHPRILSVELILAGRDAVRSEDQVPNEPPWWDYAYSAWLDGDPFGWKFTARTSSLAKGDYVLNKAVLDRMMASLEFTSTPEVASTPKAVTYVEKDQYPFTVIDSAQADSLFETPDTCTNPEAGYTVTYPDDWYTNTAIGDWSACTWFSPIFYDVGDDPNAVPAQVAIVLEFGDMSFGYTSEPEYTVADDLAVDGFATRRSELIGSTSPNGMYFPRSPLYSYIVTLAEGPGDQPTVYATTEFEGAADYELNKAVLDRIMANLEFEE